MGTRKRSKLLIVIFLVGLIAVGWGIPKWRGRIRSRGTPPNPWLDEISTISAAEFWRQLEEFELIPNEEFDSLWRELPESVEPGPITDEVAVRVLLAIEMTDLVLSRGPHVELVDYDGSHILGEPLIQSICAFRNSRLDVWVLRQKTYSRKGMGLFAFMQDKSVEPNTVRFFRYSNGMPSLVVNSECFACHSNGPRAIHPARPDLISGIKYAAEINKYCGEQERIETIFNGETDFGPELRIAECVECHSTSSQRGPLYRIHARPIRSLISRSFMPPRGGTLSREGSVELERWLNGE